MSESDCKDGLDQVTEKLTNLDPTEEHLDVWAEETFDRLSKQTKYQKKRQLSLQADLGELMDTFEELTDSYVD